MRRRQYDKEFKLTIINLLNSGHTMRSLCSEYDLKAATVYRWKKEFKTETGAFKDEATLAYEQEIRLSEKTA